MSIFAPLAHISGAIYRAQVDALVIEFVTLDEVVRVENFVLAGAGGVEGETADVAE